MLVLAIAGCRPRSQIAPHYLPGIVAGSEHIFRKVKIAVLPASSALSSGRIEIGRIYAVDGVAESSIYIVDAPGTFSQMLTQAVSDAGLEPIAIASDDKLPAKVDYVLSSTLERIEVNKKFGADETVHGQYF